MNQKAQGISVWSGSFAAGLSRTAIALALLAFCGIGAPAASAAPPTVTIEPATNVAYTTADVQGEVDPADHDTAYHFEYVTDAQFNEEPDPLGAPGVKAEWLFATHDGFGFPLAGSGDAAAPEYPPLKLTGLEPFTTYHLRLLAENSPEGEQVEDIASTFTTKGPITPPTVSSAAAETVGYATAAVTGELELANDDPGFDTTACRFEYLSQGEWEANANAFPEPEGAPSASCAGQSGSGSHEVSAPLTGLTPGTTYHLRLVAANLGGTAMLEGSTFKTNAATRPNVTIEAPTAITTSAAHFSGTVNPNAPEAASPEEQADIEAAFHAAWNFQCNPSCGAPSGSDVPATDTPQPVEAEAAGLQPNTTYTVALHASNGGGTDISETEVFKTEAVPPTVAIGTNTAIGDEEVHLRGYVNPHNSAVTSCAFQYGPSEGSYEHSVACDENPAGGDEPIEVSATLAGLTPAATYHFRLRAKTADGGTVDTEDSIFEVASAFAESSCPNEARRTEQHSTFLPDCRAYEQVSPPDKNGGDILADDQRTRIATDGSAANFSSLSTFGDALGTSVAVDYESLRGSGGWSTHAIMPPQAPATVVSNLETLQSVYVGAFSADLSRGVFLANTPLTSDPAVSRVANIYLRDDLRTPGPGSYQLLSACPRCEEPPTQLSPPPSRPLVGGGFAPFFAGASEDFGHIIFESQQPLAADAPEGCVFLLSLDQCPGNLYESDHGALRLVGLIPPSGQTECGPSGPDCETAHGSQAGQGAGSFRNVVGLTPHTISSDGSRIFLTVPDFPESQNGTLYMREDHAATVQLNASERTPCLEEPEICEAQPATYWDASADGSRVFFTTTAALTDDAPGGGTKLYMYDASKPASDPHNLTLVSTDHEPGHSAEVISVQGASRDGHYVYFAAAGQLASDQPGLGAFRALFVWHDGGIRFIAPMQEPSDSIENTNRAPWSFVQPTARVTPDGTRLLFSSTSPGPGPTGYDQGHCNNTSLGSGCRELYLYSYDSRRLACVSCNPTGAAATASAFTAVRTNSGASVTSWAQNHPLSDDGRRTFFATKEALVAEDTNDAVDVYEYDASSGTVHLISSGTDEAPSYFMNTSADGSDSFILSRQHLLGTDNDGSYDLYDARSGGGFPEPPPLPAPCIGDSCQGPAVSPPSTVTPGSVAATGPANPRPCRKGKVRRRGRCVAKKHKKRAANHNRGTSR